MTGYITQSMFVTISDKTFPRKDESKHFSIVTSDGHGVCAYTDVGSVAPQLPLGHVFRRGQRS